MMKMTKKEREEMERKRKKNIALFKEQWEYNTKHPPFGYARVEVAPGVFRDRVIRNPEELGFKKTKSKQ